MHTAVTSHSKSTELYTLRNRLCKYISGNLSGLSSVGLYGLARVFHYDIVIVYRHCKQVVCIFVITLFAFEGMILVPYIVSP